MGRPSKNNADYFSHDADASADEKILYLESYFGLTGYAFYFKFLEILTRADYFEIELSDLKKPIYAKKIGVSMPEFESILLECIKIGLLIKSGNKVYSEGLKKRLSPLETKREKYRQKILLEDEKNKKKIIMDVENPILDVEKTHKIILDNENAVLDGENSILDGEKYTKESKVKKSKVKESKVNNNTPYIPQEEEVNFLRKNGNAESVPIYTDEFFSNIYQLYKKMTGKEIDSNLEIFIKDLRVTLAKHPNKLTLITYRFTDEQLLKGLEYLCGNFNYHTRSNYLISLDAIVRGKQSNSRFFNKSPSIEKPSPMIEDEPENEYLKEYYAKWDAEKKARKAKIEADAKLQIQEMEITQ